jgi:DNA repair protein RadA/Sms
VALIPKANAPKKAIEGMRLLPVERVDEAIAALRDLD